MSGTMKFDVRSALELRWAATDADIIKHGLAFQAFEEQQPVNEQLKDLSPLFFRELIKTAEEAAAEARQGEAERAHAAELVRQADVELRPLVDLAIVRLKNRYAHNLADLELYGLKTTTGPRGVSVQKPRDAIGRRAFCLVYVERESSLPAEQQITDPPLSRMTAIAQILRDNQTERTTQVNRRQINVANRTAASQVLLDALQAAAAVIIVTRLGGKVTFELQQWGYDVVAKTAPKPPEPVEPAAPAPAEPANP